MKIEERIEWNEKLQRNNFRIKVKIGQFEFESFFFFAFWIA